MNNSTITSSKLQKTAVLFSKLEQNIKYQAEKHGYTIEHIAEKMPDDFKLDELKEFIINGK